MLAAVRSATLLGVEGRPVTVEVHVSTGLPAFQIVGLPDEACRESRDRVRAAVLSSGLPWPSSGSRSTSRHRTSARAAPGSTWRSPSGCWSPDGEIPAEADRRVRLHRRAGSRRLAARRGRRRPDGRRARRSRSGRAARGRIREAQGHRRRRCVRVAGTLREVVDALNGEAPWPDEPDDEFVDDDPPRPDLADVRGQAVARKALEVAAAGGHHLLLVGPPGPGKTMLAQRLPGLLPPLTPAVALEATMVHSAAGVRLPAARHDPPRAVPGTAPQQFDGVVGRRRHIQPAPRRDQPRPRWRAVPRRARRVLTDGARRVCVSRWRKVSSASPGRGPAPRCRPGSCSSRPPTRARAAAARRARASATTALGCATCAGSVVRCSIASTSASASPVPTSTISCTAAAARARPSPRLASRLRAGLPSTHRGMLNSEIPAVASRHSRAAASVRPADAARRARARAADRPRLSPHPPRRAHARRSRRRFVGAGRPNSTWRWRCSCGCGCGSRLASRPHDASICHPRHTPRRSPRSRTCRSIASARCCATTLPTRRTRSQSATTDRRGLIERVLADADVRAAWQRAGRSPLLDSIWGRCTRLGVQVLVHGSPATRRCSSTTRCRRRSCSPRAISTCSTGAASRSSALATPPPPAATPRRTLGRESRRGRRARRVGLARGIDGCAHRGALQADGRGRPIAVVASGHDVVYPREHRDLWCHVAEKGLLLSEAPPGTPPEAYRFPLRNRIIAALAEVVIVVESREHGGSLITVNEALERNVPLMAVPGGVHNRAAAGTNQLIRDGAAWSSTPPTCSSPWSWITDAAPALAPILGRAHAAPTSTCTRPVPASRGPSTAWLWPAR